MALVVTTVVDSSVVDVSVLVVTTVVFDVFAGTVNAWVIVFPVVLPPLHCQRSSDPITLPRFSWPDSTHGAGGVLPVFVPKLPSVTRSVVVVVVVTTGPVTVTVGPEFRSMIGSKEPTKMDTESVSDNGTPALSVESIVSVSVPLKARLPW